MKLLQFYVDDLIKRAITEDINYIDSTTDLLIDEDDISEAYFVSVSYTHLTLPTN